jgi:hypothetical protein
MRAQLRSSFCTSWLSRYICVTAMIWGTFWKSSRRGNPPPKGTLNRWYQLEWLTLASVLISSCTLSVPVAIILIEHTIRTILPNLFDGLFNEVFMPEPILTRRLTELASSITSWSFIVEDWRRISSSRFLIYKTSTYPRKLGLLDLIPPSINSVGSANSSGFDLKILIGSKYVGAAVVALAACRMVSLEATW